MENFLDLSGPALGLVGIVATIVVALYFERKAQRRQLTAEKEAEHNCRRRSAEALARQVVRQVLAGETPTLSSTRVKVGLRGAFQQEMKAARVVTDIDMRSVVSMAVSIVERQEFIDGGVRDRSVQLLLPLHHELAEQPSGLAESQGESSVSHAFSFSLFPDRHKNPLSMVVAGIVFLLGMLSSRVPGPWKSDGTVSSLISYVTLGALAWFWSSTLLTRPSERLPKWASVTSRLLEQLVVFGFILTLIATKQFGDHPVIQAVFSAWSLAAVLWVCVELALLAWLRWSPKSVH